MSITKRRGAMVASGALVALAGSMLSITAAHADTPNFTLNPANQQTVHPIQFTGSFPADVVAVTDSAGRQVDWPTWGIGGLVPPSAAFPLDPNNVNNATTFTPGMFIYNPTTKVITDNLTNMDPEIGVQFPVFRNSAPFPGNGFNGQPSGVDPDLYSAAVRSLTPGQTFDWIASEPLRDATGAQPNLTTLGANDPYYVLPVEYFGLNPATGVYEVGPVGDPNRTVHEVQKADTTTVITAVPSPSSVGGVDLTATIEDSSGATDTSATGTVTFTAGSVSVTATVTDGVVATTTVAHSSSLPYSTPVSFTGVYSGDGAFNGSTSAAVSVTTADQPAFLDQKTVDETVTIPAPAAGTIKLSVAAGSVAFGSAVADPTTGNFTANAALPTTSVADTRFAKDAWTLNGSSNDLTTADHANTITADHLSWAAPTVTGTAGAVSGGANASLATDKPLATFAAATIAGEADTTVNTTLGLTVPETQAQGDYSGTLTVTLVG